MIVPSTPSFTLHPLLSGSFSLPLFLSLGVSLPEAITMQWFNQSLTSVPRSHGDLLLNKVYFVGSCEKANRLKQTDAKTCRCKDRETKADRHTFVRMAHYHRNKPIHMHTPHVLLSDTAYDGQDRENSNCAKDYTHSLSLSLSFSLSLSLSLSLLIICTDVSHGGQSTIDNFVMLKRCDNRLLFDQKEF